MNTYVYYWLDGKKHILRGNDQADAMNRAGFGQGSLGALDFYTGTGDSYYWDPTERAWVYRHDGASVFEPAGMTEDRVGYLQQQFVEIMQYNQIAYARVANGDLVILSYKIVDYGSLGKILHYEAKYQGQGERPWSVTANFHPKDIEKAAACAAMFVADIAESMGMHDVGLMKLEEIAAA